MKKNIKIEGMSCAHCVMHVTDALEKVAGVEKVKVDLKKKEAFVEGNQLDEILLKAAVSDAGYDPVAVESS